MPQMLNPNDKSENVALSADLFTVHVKQRFGSVRALEPIPSEDGVYFYEVNLLSSTQVMQFGWATKECFLYTGSGDGVGDDRYSIGFDASNRHFIWHGTAHLISDLPTWQVGDIVGCLIDVPNKNFIFYLNGREFDVRNKLNIDVHFSDMPYYPAASLDSDMVAQAYFNFGQQPFRYPPKSVEFNDFYGYRFNRYFQSLDRERLASTNSCVILSDDGFSARNTSRLNSSIEAVYGLKPVSGQGVYFYEVKLMSDGLMKIGWAVENQPLSIGFDGYRKLIWIEQKQHNITTFCWKVGDVLGCLVDVAEKNFIFYHNGKEFDLQQLRIFGLDLNSIGKCRPAVELAAGQQVYCNFGQEKFRFGPDTIEYQDFCGNRFDQALQEI